MKKKTTTVNQPDQPEGIKSESLPRQVPAPKMYRDHSHFHHAHGRVNVYPFGSNQGPVAF
jgi:hypothetical protein